MPEAFHSRFPVSVKSKKLPARKAKSLFLRLRRSCLRPAADETKLPVALEKKPLVPTTQGDLREFMKISCEHIILQIKVKHFGVILLHSTTFCTALYFTTYKGHLSSLIYHVWQHGIRFFSSNNACMPSS